MDTAQWHQEIGLVKPLELQVPSSSSSITNTATTTSETTGRLQGAEKRVRPQKEQALHCPRCNSANTKFCYYNNYSLTQPRYFCKTCRRYWTEGGSLRNVPVGGGSRKNKRSSLSTASTSTAAASTSKKLPVAGDLIPAAPHKLIQDGQDLNLTFPHTNAVGALSAMELLRGSTTGMSGAGIGPLFVPMQLQEYSAGFGLQEFRAPVLNFTAEGIGGREGGGEGGRVVYGDVRVQDLNSGTGRLLFPFEDVKPDHSSTVPELENGSKGHGGDPPPFWNGLIGGGGSW